MSRLAEQPFAPAADAHNVEAFSLEDDLRHLLLPVVGRLAEPVADFHPADFARPSSGRRATPETLGSSSTRRDAGP